MRILFAAGGTGGHLSPALNLACAVEGSIPPGRAFFLTAGRNVEDGFLSARSFPREALFPGISSRPSPCNPTPWLRAMVRARRALRSFRPDALVATGGYVSLPLVAARLLFAPAPLYLLEQNALPGRAVRFAASFARLVFCHYDEAARLLGRRASAPGSPLPDSFALPPSFPPSMDRPAGGEGKSLAEKEAREQARVSFGLDPAPKTLLVAGGSLGSKGLNEMVLRNAGTLGRGLQVLHITGEGDFEKTAAFYGKSDISAKVLPFCDRMKEAYTAADLIVCRGGGMTVAEVCALGLPSVLVPYPHHRDDHQYRNAGVVARAGGGVILDEKEATEEAFRRTVVDLLENDERLARMARAARALAKPRAAEEILERIREDLGKGGRRVA